MDSLLCKNQLHARGGPHSRGAQRVPQEGGGRREEARGGGARRRARRQEGGGGGGRGAGEQTKSHYSLIGVDRVDAKNWRSNRGTDWKQIVDY